MHNGAVDVSGKVAHTPTLPAGRSRHSPGDSHCCCTPIEAMHVPRTQACRARRAERTRPRKTSLLLHSPHEWRATSMEMLWRWYSRPQHALSQRQRNGAWICVPHPHHYTWQYAALLPRTVVLSRACDSMQLRRAHKLPRCLVLAL